MINRILIMGCAGCGKSTLADALSEKLSIPHYHLDTFYWQPGWVEAPHDEFVAKQKELIALDKWIIDGNYRSTLELRLARAELIIFLDYKRSVALKGILKRYFKYRNKTRDSIAIGCEEKIDKDFLKWVWNFKKDGQPILFQMINKYPNIPVLIFKNRRQTKKFLKNISNILHSI